MNGVAVGIQTALTSDTGAGGVSTLTSGAIFQQNATQGTSFPFVIFYKVSNSPAYAWTNAQVFEDGLYAFEARAKDDTVNSGATMAQTIMERISTLLKDNALTGSSRAVINLRRKMDFPDLPADVDPADNERIYRRGAYFEVQVV